MYSCTTTFVENIPPYFITEKKITNVSGEKILEKDFLFKLVVPHSLEIPISIPNIQFS